MVCPVICTLSCAIDSTMVCNGETPISHGRDYTGDSALFEHCITDITPVLLDTHVPGD